MYVIFAWVFVAVVDWHIVEILGRMNSVLNAPSRKQILAIEWLQRFPWMSRMASRGSENKAAHKSRWMVLAVAARSIYLQIMKHRKINKQSQMHDELFVSGSDGRQIDDMTIKNW